MTSVRGPTNFTELDCPGVLVEPTDCPPAILEAHTPLYYRDFLERYGMEKEYDTFAWRAPLRQLGPDLSGLPPEIVRVAGAVRRMTDFTVRKIRLEDWDREVSVLGRLFDVTLRHIPDHVPVPEADFRRFADQLRSFVDPDLALLAEVDGEPVGFCVALPDANRVLIHLNGRLFPLGWLKAMYYRRRVEVVSFKLLGVLEQYRRRGIDAVLYIETLRAAYNRGYVWLDGSLSHEFNPLVAPMAQRLGAERYKHYRLYQCKV
jgi:GNAT superfamily N-acetyltransferase